MQNKKLQTDAKPIIGHLVRGAAAVVVIWLLACLVVIVGELLPGDSAPMAWIGASHISDKVLHFGAYTVLAFIPVLGFPLRAGLLAAASMIFLGIALEYGQTLVPGRSFEVADMAANTAGVLTGSALALLIRRYRATTAAGEPEADNARPIDNTAKLP